MPIGISTLCTFGQPYKRLNEYTSSGTPLIEVLDDWKDRISRAKASTLLELASCHGTKFTVHSPILDMNIASANARFRSLSIRQVKESIDPAASIGAGLVVVHPGSSSPLDDYYRGTHWEHNVASLRTIVSYAEDAGVTAAIENMPRHVRSFLKSPGEFRQLEELGFDLKMTLDVGHANTTSNLRDFVEDFKAHIVHVHIHDNKGGYDEHLGAGRGTVDWDYLRSSLSFTKITGVVESTSFSDATACLERANHLFRT